MEEGGVRNTSGGYVWNYNSTLVCTGYITPQCLAESPNVFPCVAAWVEANKMGWADEYDIPQLSSNSSSSPPAKPTTSSHSSNHARNVRIGVGVGVGVGVIVLLAAVAGLALLSMRAARKHQARHEGKLDTGLASPE